MNYDPLNPAPMYYGQPNKDDPFSEMLGTQSIWGSIFFSRFWNIIYWLQKLSIPKLKIQDLECPQI